MFERRSPRRRGDVAMGRVATRRRSSPGESTRRLVGVPTPRRRRRTSRRVRAAAPAHPSAAGVATPAPRSVSRRLRVASRGSAARRGATAHRRGPGRRRAVAPPVAALVGVVLARRVRRGARRVRASSRRPRARSWPAPPRRSAVRCPSVPRARRRPGARRAAHRRPAARRALVATPPTRRGRRASRGPHGAARRSVRGSSTAAARRVPPFRRHDLRGVGCSHLS